MKNLCRKSSMGHGFASHGQINLIKIGRWELRESYLVLLWLRGTRLSPQFAPTGPIAPTFRERCRPLTCIVIGFQSTQFTVILSAWVYTKFELDESMQQSYKMNTLLLTKMVRKYCGATSSFHPRGFTIAVATARLAPAVPTPLSRSRACVLHYCV